MKYLLAKSSIYKTKLRGSWHKVLSVEQVKRKQSQKVIQSLPLLPNQLMIASDTKSTNQPKNCIHSEEVMNELSFSFIEVSGSSSTTLAEAMRNALVPMIQSIHQVLWVEKIETHAVMDSGQIIGWQVLIRIGFAEEPASQQTQHHWDKQK